MKNNTADFLWKLRMLRKEPFLVVFIVILLALLTLFVIYPLVMIIRYSITSDGGTLSLQTLFDVLQNRSYRTTFSNSIKLGVISAVIATVIGYIFAFTITRTEVPLKGFMKTMATIPIISPPFVLSLSIIFLFGRKGLVTNGLLGITDFNVYGMHSLILVQVLSFFPVAYLTLSGILQAIDASVEDAALNLGASR
jgi:iron(III) transport system permease protein